ncbi:hypothetical protein BA190_26845 [Labrys sp. WJW]|uniref:hypothetical protein n=1 Tax=Labrys sp. WJW TaxID=1737983 RepID=UPI0008315401|nr:hypothetical protein [Labrys sp. WJW]OCC01833.1 hypothetical protein BA190_26845 [Labrys sp. WJW]
MATVQTISRAELKALCGFDVPTSPQFDLLNYVPPGPVGAAYIRSMGPIDCITGPAGSGKTVASVFKPIRLSVGAVPVGKDGVVHVRGCVVRDNYRALYRTTLRSWFQFFPPDWGGSRFFGGQDRPAQHVLRLATVRGGREVPVDLTVDFFAVGDVAIEELLKGYECTWGWCNEADLLHERVPTFLYSRTGRYPARADLVDPEARIPRLVQCDFNPTDIDHPLYRDLVEAPRESFKFFHQPSGLSAEAENRSGKTFLQYQEEAATMTKEDKRRFVDGLWGYSSDGRPVYHAEFDQKRHVAAGTIKPVPGLPIDIGFDQGLSPAAILTQTLPTGQMLVLAEVVPDHGTGIERFLAQLLAVLMSDRFRGLPLGLLAADPAGFYGADRIAGQMTWAESVGMGLGRPILPAPSNEPDIRIESVRILLTKSIDNATPALLIDPSCRMVIGGFAAHYKFKRIRTATSDRYEDRPEKNKYSNPHDALQYITLTKRGRMGVIEDAAKGLRAGVVPIGQARDRRERRAAGGDFSVWDT